MTVNTDSQRRPVFVDRRNNRFFADPLIGNGAWPQVPLAVFYGSYATDPTSNPYGTQRAVGDLYFNTSANILKVWDGSLWQDAGGSNSSVFRWKKTAAGGETTLSGLDDGATSLAYTAGSEFLYLNGALLARGVDYTASNGTSITGLSALTAGDIVEIFSFNELNLANLNAGTVAFAQTGAGAVQRTVEGKLRDVISVKDFGAVGDGVADDTAAIQAAINAAMQVGKPVSIPGPGPYLITSTLQVKITRDALPVDTTPASDIHFSDITSAWIMGDGMPTLKAGSVMASMLELIFDTTDLDLGPFYSRIEGIGFDGNNLATTGIKSNFSMHVSILKNRIWNLSKGIEYTGYGVARIEGNVIRAANGIYFLAGGGDSLIQGNDFYAAGNNSNCIYLGYYTGNLSISSNTFTDEAAYTASCAIRLVGSTAPAFEEIRDVVIDKNEFCGFASAVRADGKSSAIKNIYRITLTKNHTLPFGGVGTGVLLEAVDCKEILVEGNFLNALSLAAASGKGVACVRCEHTKLVNNYFANYSISALELTNCTDSDIQSNKFVDCAKTGSSYVVVVLYGSSSARNYFRHNIFNQTSGTYGQYGILEDAGVDYTYSFDNIFTGMSYPHTKTGSNSVMRRTEYASAVPSTGSYYVGDIIWNTNPAAGGTPGWICTTSGVNSFVFKAMANLAA